MTKRRTVKTQWQYATYDVWGNERDGFEVNDVYRRREPVDLTLEVTTYNVGMPQQFDSASPSDKQIRALFGLGKSQIDTDGDDITIYVNRRRNSYPIGELICVSHESLSPIREKAIVAA